MESRDAYQVGSITPLSSTISIPNKWLKAWRSRVLVPKQCPSVCDRIKSAVKQWSGTCIESVIQCHTILWVSVLKVTVWRCMPHLIVQNMLDVATSPPQISWVARWILEVGDFNIPRGGQQLCSCPAMGITFASATWKNGVIGKQLVVCGQRQTCTQISIFASWIVNIQSSKSIDFRLGTWTTRCANLFHSWLYIQFIIN